MSSTDHLIITKDTEGDEGEYLLGSNVGEFYKNISTSEKLHFTFVLKTQAARSGWPTYYEPRVLVYVNGEFVSERVCRISEFTQIEQLRILFVKQTVEAGKSVCVDNIQVSSFGTSANSYHGALDNAYNDHSINLTECADSVLYNKNN